MTGFEEARAVLSDRRFSADRVRHREATSLQPHEVAEPAAGTLPQGPAIESREDGLFVFMDPPEPRLRNEVQLGFKQVKWIGAIEFVADFAEIGGGHGGYNQDHEFFGYRESL